MNTVLNWSSGKDAALAYHILSNIETIHVTHLLTTINAARDRIIMHGIRTHLLDAQAERMKLPLKKIYLPPTPTDEVYQKTMSATLHELKAEGVNAAAFGDIFLEDLKNYREQQLQQIAIKAIFPLWKKNTRQLVETIEATGIEAIIVCVNEKHLDKRFLGRKIDRQLLNELPPHVDACGENGEYHTFVVNAPFFSAPVPYAQGEITYQRYPGNPEEGFYFLDLC